MQFTGVMQDVVDIRLRRVLRIGLILSGPRLYSRDWMSEGIEVSILKLAFSSHASVQCCILEMRARFKGLG